MAKDLRLDVVSDADPKGLLEEAAAMDRLADKTDKLGNKFKEVEGDSFALDAALEETKLKVNQLSQAFADTGDKSLLRLIAQQKRYQSQLEGIDATVKKVKTDVTDTEKPVESFGQLWASSLRDGENAFQGVSRAIDATKARITSLRAGFRSTGDESVFGDLTKAENDLKKLTNVAEAMVPDFAKAGSSGGSGFVSAFTDAFGEGMPAMPEIIAGALFSPGTYGIAALAGTMIGGAVLTGIGLAGIGAGIAIDLKDPVIQQALGGLKTSIGSELRDAAKPMIQPLYADIEGLQGEFARLAPGIKATFASLAPSLSALGTGADGFLGQLVPDIEKAVAAAGPLLDKLGQDLPGLGASIGSVFTTIADHSGAAEVGLQMIVGSIESIARIASITITVLSAMFQQAITLADAVAQPIIRIIDLLDDAADAMHWPGSNSLDDMRQKADNAGVGLLNLNAAASGTAPAMTGAAGATNLFAGSAENAAIQAQALDTALGAMDAALSESEQVQQLTIGMKELDKQLKATKGSLNQNTLAGAQNVLSYEQQIDAAKKHRDAMINDGKSASGANAEFMAYVRQLDASMEAAGASKKAIDKLNKSLGITAAMGDIQVGINITAHESALAKAAIQHQLSRVPHRAAGGPYGPGPVLVGEQGPEIIVPNSSGTVIPNNRIGAAIGGAAGASVVEFRAAQGDRLAEFLLSLLRPTIRTRYGGDVTKALSGVGV